MTENKEFLWIYRNRKRLLSVHKVRASPLWTLLSLLWYSVLLDKWSPRKYSKKKKKELLGKLTDASL